MQTMMLLLLAAGPMQDDLQAMIASSGDAYVVARNRLLERATLAEIETRKSANRYSAASWREDVIVDAAHFWLSRRADAERAHRLEGLQPEIYRKRRRPEPEAARELVRLNAAPIAFEILLKTFDRYPVSTEHERAALEDALVIALGRSDHPAAPLALMEIAHGDRRRASLRELAAAQLRGEAELVSLLSDPALRRGAVIGLGQVRTLGSVRALISAAEDRAVRLAAIRSLSSAASPFVLRRSRNPDAAAIRAESSRALVAMLIADAEHADALVEAIGIVRDPQALAQLSALDLADDAARARIARARQRLRAR